MPGVEILNTTIHYKEVLPTWALIVIIAIIVIPAVASLIGADVADLKIKITEKMTYKIDDNSQVNENTVFA